MKEISKTGEVVLTTASAFAERAKQFGAWKHIPEKYRDSIGRLVKLHDYLVHRAEREQFRDQGIETRVVPAVQIFLFRDGWKGVEVYLGKRKAGGFLGQWCPPGGKREKGQSFEEAALEE